MADKILYVSDLDNTLLGKDSRLSPFTLETAIFGSAGYIACPWRRANSPCAILPAYGSAVSDECYAVDNACDELKQLADGIIGSNADDGIARFLNHHGCLFHGLTDRLPDE